MPIEFRCHRCQRLLRTADNTAGKQTKCPECGTILDIPNAAAAPPPPPAASPFGGSGAGTPPPLPSGPPSQNPYASPVAQAAVSTPQIALGLTPTPIDVGDILSRTWTIFSNNLAQMILGMLIFFAVTIAVTLPAIVILFVGMGAGAALAEQGNEAVGAIIMIVCFFVFFALLFLVTFWLYGGWALWLLKIARGQPSNYSDIFHGGRYLTRILGAGLLMSLAIMLGYLLCIVPGVILALMFGQFMWIIVDRDAQAMESLSLSRQLTDGNKLNLFLLMLVIMAISMVASFIPFAGLFTTPFMWLLFAVTYLRLSGQPTADMLSTPAQPVILPPAGNPTSA